MGRNGKRRRSTPTGSVRRAGPGAAEPRDPLDDVFESGGDLFLAVGYTPGGFPFGPRVEIVDGELTFPDEAPIDTEPQVAGEGDGRDSPARAPLDHDTPF